MVFGLRRTRRGFSLTGGVVLIVVAALAVPPMTTLLYQTLMGHGKTDTRITAVTLAKGLMEEILSRHFEDPDSAAGSFGTEEGSRSAYDDVDDYDGLNDKPLRDSQGNALSRYADFRTQVTVENVASSAPGGTAVSDGSTSFKRITVTVKYNSDRDYVRLLGLISNFRANHSPLTVVERSSSSSEDLNLNAEGVQDCGKVWDYQSYNTARCSSGDGAMLNQGKAVFVPAGTTMTVEVRNFYNSRKGGGQTRNMDGTADTVGPWAPPYKYLSISVPAK